MIAELDVAPTPPSRSRSLWPIALLALLVVSFSLRTVLLLRGGQNFFPDEHRYARSRTFLQLLATHNFRGALDSLMTSSDHTGFVIVGTVPALAQSLLLQFQGAPILSTLWVPALACALSSTACIALTYGIATRFGAVGREAFIAAFLMSCANSMFYYSRHIVPYDIALAFVLGSLFVGGRENTRSSLLSGVMAGLAFLIYNGYWVSVVIALLVHVLRGSWAGPDLIRRSVSVGSGAAAPTVGLVLAGFATGIPYLQGMSRFSSTVTQCDLQEGWSVGWEYLWHTEHGLLLVWAVAALALLWPAKGPAVKRGRLWLLCMLGVELLLTIFSTGLGRFCVYGRLARQVVPFLCLATAAAAVGLTPKLGAVLAALAAVQAGFNFEPPFDMRFPRDFASEAQDAAAAAKELRKGQPRTSHEATIVGPPAGGYVGPARFVLLNARYLWPAEGSKDAPPGVTLLREAHPLQFLPYQYESFSRRERALLRTTDISMRFIDTSSLDSPSPR